MKKKYCLILLVFLVGCSEIAFRPQSENDIVQQNQREKVKHWKLYGRLSVTGEKENGTVTFHWTQDDQHYLMRFIPPLGQGAYVLRGGDDGVYLFTPQNEILHADDAAGLLSQSVGWHVPMSGFRYWVRGLPEPGTQISNRQFDKHGRVSQMQQDDWQISIKRYTDVDGVALPDKIFMHSDHCKLKLIIQAWDVKP